MKKRGILSRAAPLAAAAVLLTGMVGTASAASILSLMKSGNNQASDEDREYLIDRNWNGIAAGLPGSNAGQLDVGDSLRGLVSMNTLNSGSGNVGGITPNNEWTGVFQAVVSSKVALGGGIFSFNFAPDPVFEGVYGAGALIAMFEDSTKDVKLDWTDIPGAEPKTIGGFTKDDGTAARSTNPPSSADVSSGPYLTEEAFVATATDSDAGVPFWVLGFTGTPGTVVGEGWNAVTLPGLGDNVLGAFTFTDGSSGAIFNAGLSLLSMDPALASTLQVNRVTPSPFGTTDFALTGNVKGVENLDTVFEASSDLTLSWNATVVPEPTTMLLLGTGLMGIAYTARRRKV